EGSLRQPARAHRREARSVAARRGRRGGWGPRARVDELARDGRRAERELRAATLRRPSRVVDAVPDSTRAVPVIERIARADAAAPEEARLARSGARGVPQEARLLRPVRWESATPAGPEPPRAPRLAPLVPRGHAGPERIPIRSC